MVDVDFDKYEKLSLSELAKLVTDVGINFTIGNENITDKQEFLSVLDEANSEELETAYRKIIAAQSSSITNTQK